MKDKDRMAKAINAEFSDEDDDDNRSNWDEDEKVISAFFWKYEFSFEKKFQ